MGKFVVPATIVGNSDGTAVRCLALANRAGRSIGLDHAWQALIAAHTFPTVSGTADYSLPTAFHRFLNITQWDQTNNAPLMGPLSAIEWNALQQSSVSVGSPLCSYFRVAGGSFSIYPTPTSVRTIGFDYRSKYWVQGKAEFSADADIPVIDADLLTLGLRWRLLQQLGDAYESEKREYMERLDALQAADGGRDAIRMGTPYVSPYGNLPESGFGV